MSDSDFCCDACEDLNDQLTRRNRKAAGRASLPEPTTVPEEEEETHWTTDGMKEAFREPCVLHGLLTEADAKVLERRWIGMESWRLVKPVREPDVVLSEVA